MPITLRRLRNLDEKYSKQYATAKREMNLLDKEIQRVKMQIIDHRKELSKSGNWNENQQRVRRHKITLENRLQTATTTVNSHRYRNKRLRQDIDRLRREQVLRRTKHTKLASAMDGCKRENQAVREDLREAK